MSQDEIIRAEIRQLLGVSEGRLSNIINHSNANMPLPIERRKDRSGHNFVNIYDRAEIMEWIATEPLKNAVVRPKENQKPPEYFGTVNFLAFMFGFDSVNKRIARYHKVRQQITSRMCVINLDGENGPLLT